MNKDNAPAAFIELDSKYLNYQDQVRDDIACLLGETLRSCPEEHRVMYVEKAYMAYERLAAMHGILHQTAFLVDPRDLI